MNDLVTESLEIASEIKGDIAPAIYERYFERCPGSKALMSHIDELVQGKMMVEVYLLSALMDTVAESLAEQWTPKMSEAWEDRLHMLNHEIETRLPLDQRPHVD
jgi:hypothetical protein